MRKLAFTLFLAVSASLTAQAQTTDDGWTIPEIDYDSIANAVKAEKYQPIRYCMSYSDYMNNNWIEGDTVQMIEYDMQEMYQNGWNDFRFSAKEKEYDKLLKKDVFALVFDGDLYVNCFKLKEKHKRYGKGYSLAYRFDNDKIFLANMHKVSAKQITLSLAGQYSAGIFGNLILGGSVPPLNPAYFIESDDWKVKPIKTELMEQLLSPYPEVLKQYREINGKTKRENAETVSRYLMYVGLIKDFSQ
ncbi:MAG: hypothetical protein IJV27_05050 [Prevotella sp.]|nr:hypothetical protein [Prevotella sp.]